MKARIKATGEILEILDIGVSGKYFYLSNDKKYSRNELEFLSETIDWQHYRIQASIAAMQGMLANPKTFEQLEHDERYKDIRGGDKLQIVVIASVMYGYTLVEELKKRGGQDE